MISNAHTTNAAGAKQPAKRFALTDAIQARRALRTVNRYAPLRFPARMRLARIERAISATFHPKAKAEAGQPARVQLDPPPVVIRLHHVPARTPRNGWLDALLIVLMIAFAAAIYAPVILGNLQ